MQQRDILKEEIEQFGRAIGKMIADFIGLKTKGDINISIEETKQQFKGNLDLDIEEILAQENINEYFLENKWTAGNLEQLAMLLKELGKAELKTNPISAKEKLKKALAILELASEKSGVYSFEREEMKKGIKDKLKMRA